MNRILICGLACCATFLPIARGQSLSLEERRETAHFAEARQNPDGGFSGVQGGHSTLGETLAAIRVLRYTGSSIPDVLKCIEFVRSCIDQESGGIAPGPGDRPDATSTSLGVMALGELRLVDEESLDSALQYLEVHADTFPDYRLAVAAFEAAERESPRFVEWTGDLEQLRNADGTWGSGPGLAFDTGGMAATILRMGGTLDPVESILEAIRSGQRADGGWGQDDAASTLPSTYRVMRAAFMLRSPPDLGSLRRFVAGCRREGGGYAESPEVKEATLSSTYMATILLRWSDQLEGRSPLPEVAGYTPLFNGENLSGWEGDQELWEVRDGLIVGTSPGLDRNDFLASEARFDHFRFQCRFLLKDGEGNSGIQFRSERLPGPEMAGYQADIGEDYWGGLYDESRRNHFLARASERARRSVRPDHWNEYEIRASGNQIRLTLNGHVSVDYVEDDPEIPNHGRFGLQLHAGAPMVVQFGDVYVQKLPLPDVFQDQKTPGFQLRTLRDDTEIRYCIAIPPDYDGTTEFPVVLFLHGSGERGQDGVLPTQVGLGPSIASDPSGHPYIAVFPQARETWQADSPDARRALAILDDVIETYRVDHERIVLTGLSMGGMGTWSIAAQYPERFSAIVPICGPGELDSVDALRMLPVWSFVGDNDRSAFIEGMRSMARALTNRGAPLRHTEYLGVGHNSWDRAYSETELRTWMLSHRRVQGRD